MYKRLFVGLLFFIFHAFVVGQQWNDHLNFTSATFSGKVGDKLFAGNSIGLFTYHLDDFVLEKMSKTNLLSDVDITAVATHEGLLVVGYQNGNIDVVKNSRVVNIPDIRLNNTVSNKKINRLLFIGNLLYCCTDFGVVVVDIQRREVADTYYIGDESQNFRVFGLLIDQQDIYAATEKGLFRADKNSASLSYYGTWKNVGGDLLAYCDVMSFNGGVIAFRGSYNSTVSIRVLRDGVWSQMASVSGFITAEAFNDGLVVASSNAVRQLTPEFKLVDLFTKYTFSDVDQPVGTAIRWLSIDAKSSRLVVADLNYGLVYCGLDGGGFHVSPNAPRSNNCFRIAASSKGVYVVPGGLTSAWNNLNRPLEFSYYNNGMWSSYVRAANENYRDAINIAINPLAPDSVYISCWGSGVLKVNGATKEKHFTPKNSLLQNIANLSDDYVRVGGLCYDNQSNLFMSNAEVSVGMIVKTPQNKWYRLSYPPVDNLHSIGNFMVTRDNILWASLPRSNRGLFVLSTNGTVHDSSDDTYRSVLTRNEDRDVRNKGPLQIWDENREVITNSVFAICEDKNGQVWLGTDKGIVVYYRPSSIMTDEYPVASRIKVPRNDGTNAADYLLGNEKITSIAVDGANRKWIGTENSGLFLVSSDGLQTIHSFNATNSSLLSNAITSVAVHPTSGEVFIGTDKGIVSYKSDAIEPEKKMLELRIYPNPVRENFSGDIVLEGFSADAEVVITDISGSLVFRATSLGGRAVWNGKNMNGNRVKTGVYLVMASDRDGVKGIVGKILVVK